MTLEKQLINKCYYNTLTEGSENEHPIKVLGDLFILEQQKEVTDLSYIRFAQGEVYFQNKDYETAIFKWENIHNELMPWAQKNIADANFELDFLEIAEEYYKLVETDSDDLKVEVLLQLFTLYIQRDKLEMAADSIKNAVELNPDYPNVTDMARSFFEEQQDFASGVELAVAEAIRTESLFWFEVLEGYVKEGHTAAIAPSYFRELLMTLYMINEARFESLVAALWDSYKQNDLYFQWLKEINYLLLDVNPRRSSNWQELSKQYKETYLELMNGTYLIKDLSDYIPFHLTNWMKIATISDTLAASSAVLAWNELYPAWLEDSVVSEAEDLVGQSNHTNKHMGDIFLIFESIRKWANSKDLSMGERAESIIDELLDSNNFHLLITGNEATRKASIVNRLLGKEMTTASNSSTVLFKHDEQAEVHVITDQEEKSISVLDDFMQIAENEQTHIRCKMPIPFLNKNNLSLIDTPLLTNQRKSKKDVIPYLYLADSLLFVLNSDSLLTYKEIETAVKIREHVPELPIHFLLHNMEQSTSNQVTVEWLEKTTSWIHTYFPNAKVFASSQFDEHNSQLEEFIQSMVNGYSLGEGSERKILYYSKQLIKLLPKKRIELENSIVNTIKWNEEMITKLDGAVNQLRDTEEEKAQIIKRDYSKIVNKVRQELMASIPDLLKDCAELIKEDTDFENIHVTLNDEMNKRINKHIDETVLPKLHEEIQIWIASSEGEFSDCWALLNEMSVSFNQLYDEEKLSLACDFKVLDDWRRDIDRMTRSNIQLEKFTIIKGSASSQLFMKSAGKLLGAISQNKGTLQNKFKQSIKNKDYTKDAQSITNTFMQQLEFFGKTLERDITIFFTNPFDELNRAIEENQQEIKANEQSLNNMRKNPEVYTDPLTLFEINIRQYEWMNHADEKVFEYR
ncbi:tetratricopeptide repeat protein [Oceanobacillus polygoni]|uniref:Tetratricopeptide (TPR) repeat protein n=1 Tax=Oceanobacillus polygoni TaxID=1235259 RepID=A0A9X0YPV2_9BACI|nr:GTP-binding protein [Oceanobacillus polygoni]MBP2076740.1 tetratricopeptide (TPR) repeat protein [Oceanobacillus polygoni]